MIFVLTIRGEELEKDYVNNYWDTKWKSIDMYGLNEFENIVYRGNDSEVVEVL